MVANDSKLEVSRRLFRTIDYRYVGSVLLAYIAIVMPIYWLISSYASNARQPQFNTNYLSTLAPAFLNLAIMIALPLLFCAITASVAASVDRRAVLRKSIIFYMLPLGVVSVIWMLRLGFYAITYRFFWVIWVASFFLLTLYVQVGMPMYRVWTLGECKFPEKVAWLIARAWWPFDPDEFRKIEIEIPPAKYFGLLGGLGAVVFLILESVLGEYLANTFGITGYAGASALAVFVAAVVYPVHGWASKKVTLKAPQGDEESSGKLWHEIAQKAWAYYRLLFSRHWLAMIFVIAFAFLVERLVLALFWPS